MVTALEGAATASEARGGLGNDRAPHEELHREDLLSCLLLCLPRSLSGALLPSFKCRTSPRLFDGPLAELTLIKQLNPPASLVVRSLCVQKRTLHGGRAPGRTSERASERATGRPPLLLCSSTRTTAAATAASPFRPSVRVRPSAGSIRHSKHSLCLSVTSLCCVRLPGRGRGPRGSRLVRLEAGRRAESAVAVRRVAPPPAAVSANPVSPRVIERAPPPAQAEDERK